MIASVGGEIQAAGPGWVIVTVGGFGMRVEVPGRIQAAHPGAQVFLHTQLVVREDSLTLFGFETADELEVFGILLSVSGVGPRSALGVLTELTPQQIASAAAEEDEKPFRKVSGIGPKTAKLIAVQLAGKLDPRRFADGIPAPDTASEPVSDQSRAIANVIVGLVGLGYNESQAEIAVQDAIDAGAKPVESELLRAALALLQAPRLAGRSSQQGEGQR